jgi:hypothetical protein
MAPSGGVDWAGRWASCAVRANMNQIQKVRVLDSRDDGGVDAMGAQLTAGRCDATETRGPFE